MTLTLNSPAPYHSGVVQPGCYRVVESNSNQVGIRVGRDVVFFSWSYFAEPRHVGPGEETP